MWMVYHNNQILGPWTAAEIRNALRSGAINAFDQVSKVGSEERFTVIDVDAIFTGSAAQSIEPQPLSSGLKSLDAVVLKKETSTKTRVSREPLPPESLLPTQLMNDVPPPAGDNNRFGAALANAVTKVKTQIADASHLDKTKVLEPKDMKREEKRSDPAKDDAYVFYLIDQDGKQVGPVSGDEIYEAWYHHRIDERLLVQKVGAPRMIPINAFIQWWTRGKPNMQARPPHPNRKSSSTEQEQPPRTWLYFVGVVAVLGLGVFLAVSELQSRTEISSRTADLPPRAPKLAIAKPIEDDNISLLDAQNIERNTRSRERSTAKRSPRDPQGFSPISEARGFAGSVVKIGPLTFLSSALKECQGKCAIPMQDAQGDVIEVRFFKSAFAFKLQSKQKVYITGLLSQDGQVIYPSKVD